METIKKNIIIVATFIVIVLIISLTAIIMLIDPESDSPTTYAFKHPIYGYNNETKDIYIIGYGYDYDWDPIVNNEFLANDREQALFDCTDNLTTAINNMEYLIGSYNISLMYDFPQIFNSTNENLSYLKNESRCYANWYYFFREEIESDISFNEMTKYETMYDDFTCRLNTIVQKYNLLKNSGDMHV